MTKIKRPNYFLNIRALHVATLLFVLPLALFGCDKHSFNPAADEASRILPGTWQNSTNSEDHLSIAKSDDGTYVVTETWDQSSNGKPLTVSLTGQVIRGVFVLAHDGKIYEVKYDRALDALAVPSKGGKPIVFVRSKAN